MIKILHSADLHLGARFHSLPPEEARARRQEQLAQLDQLVELCREEGCQMVLLPGDLLDRPQGCREEALALAKALEAMAVPVFIAPGFTQNSSRRTSRRRRRPRSKLRKTGRYGLRLDQAPPLWAGFGFPAGFPAGLAGGAGLSLVRLLNHHLDFAGSSCQRMGPARRQIRRPETS